MKPLRFMLCPVVALGLITLTGCVTPYDYTNYRAHPPRSILVLPPINECPDVRATYGVLSKLTRPIAEHGYYVFPSAVVDQMMRANGLPTAGEMNRLPLNKISEVIGADAVLYTTVKQYGSKYYVTTAITKVVVESRLVDVKTGVLLWQGKGDGTDFARLITMEMTDNPTLGLFIAPFVQANNVSTDEAHEVSALATDRLFGRGNQGLLFGPYVRSPWDRIQ